MGPLRPAASSTPCQGNRVTLPPYTAGQPLGELLHSVTLPWAGFGPHGPSHDVTHLPCSLSTSCICLSGQWCQTQLWGRICPTEVTALGSVGSAEWVLQKEEGGDDGEGVPDGKGVCSRVRMKHKTRKGVGVGAEKRHSSGRNCKGCGDSRSVDGEGFKGQEV